MGAKTIAIASVAGLAIATPAQADVDVTSTPVADGVELSSTVPGHR
jgi:hypothetical protein